tara:strand:- start:563 stop:715 length:153 start_codon:yes stop_codon:yes gene_type:complete
MDRSKYKVVIVSKYFILKPYQIRAISTNTGVGGGLAFINYCDTIKLGRNL